jgi:hypothetical protein
MEHDVYVCSWSQSADGFSLWLKQRPRLRADGATCAEAELALLAAIEKAGGAIQPVLEFDPPLPKTFVESKYTSPEVFLIGADEFFKTDATTGHAFETEAEINERLREIDTYFQAPICRNCKHSSSLRSDKPLLMASLPARFDGAFGFPGNCAGTMAQVVSEEFLALLSVEERNSLELRPVKRKRSRRKFHELIGPAGPPFVAVKGIEISGWQCTECGHRTWGCWLEGMAIHDFVAATDLPSSLPGVFTVGVPPEVCLAVTGRRWKELVGRKGTRGFVSQLLGVVSPRETVRAPELPTYVERLGDSMCRNDT